MLRRSCVDNVSSFVPVCPFVTVRPVFCGRFDIDSLVFLLDAHEDRYALSRFSLSRDCAFQRLLPSGNWTNGSEGIWTPMPPKGMLW